MADNLTPEQRSYCMSRIRGRDTGLERSMQALLRKRRLRFRKQVRALPGRPDIAFPEAHVAVFIDGDFWHGYRFPAWRHTLSKFWQVKIEKNRLRDQRNFAKLRRMGWRVIRIWQHTMRTDPERAVTRILSAL
jgi:DNA mismatch endonuclease (patch repair protein)